MDAKRSAKQKTNKMNAYIKSARLASPLSSSVAALEKRARAALALADIYPSELEVSKTPQASALVVSFVSNTGQPVSVLVSYTTPVALFRGEVGAGFAVEKGFYSRTTDKSVTLFSNDRHLVRLSEADFLKLLHNA